MKKIITLGISLFLALITFGQRLDYDNTSKWFFGMNVGAAWNTTDVENDTKAGWGFIIGKQYNATYGTAFSYDLRLRYLGGRWNGQDFDTTNLNHLGPNYNGVLLPYKDSLGYTVNNFDARAHELGFELAIHLNRVTDRSGWDPYIFGGANIVWHQSKGNLYDEFSQPPSIYGYDSTGFSPSNVNLLLDNNYESILDGSSTNYNVDFMPSLGIGLGYQVGPRFSIGVEHKTTFTLADNFDGYQDATPRLGIFENDIYHYTSAYMRFGFRTRASRPVPPPRPVDPVVNNPVQPTNPVDCQDPVIGLLRPNQHSVTVTEGFYVFSANVNYVANRSDITVEINGIPTTNFLYNPQTRQIETNIQLNAGSNNVKITARNACGSDSEFVTIVYDDCKAPVVRFESSCANGASVSSAAYAVRATIQNATNVVFTLNGVQTTNFNYNQTTGTFASNVTLRRGQNTIQITVTNECGTDTQTITVNYTECADAYVNFFAGNGAIVQSQEANYTVQAYVVNVTSKNQVTLKVNGVTRSFNFNTANGLLESTVALNAGQNTIQIVATNNCGTDTEIISVDYAPCVDPAIQVLLPATMSSTAQSGSQLIRAKVTNVTSANNIQIYVNGTVQAGGIFNAGTKIYEKTVALQQGINTIKIVATNQCGAVTQTLTINYNPCDNPNVQLVVPSTSGGLTSNPAQLVQAMVFNVTGMGQIQLYLNGALQAGGIYNAGNGLYQNTVTLAAGMNTIQVVATNSCGSDVKTTTIEYRRCNAPTINMIAPSANPFYTDLPGLNLSAVVTGVTSQTQVTTFVNGVVSDGGEAYTNATNTYTNQVNLVLGNNVIKLIATNDCGTVTKEINVIREEEDPIVVDEMITICYIRSNNAGEPQTIQIPTSQWPAYQAQGATLGPCPEPVDEEITICMEIGGVATQMVILESQWPAYQAQGATKGACPERTKTICLNGTTLNIPEGQWAAYQAQGATEGPCPVEPEKMTICKKGVQLEILVSEWPAYQAEGAVQGPCPPPTMVICFNNQTQTILVSEWPTYQAQGAVQGTCRAQTMEICLNETTMTIPVGQWATYQAQGAVQGPCSNKTMIICYNGRTMEIQVSKWPKMQQLGATEGECPEKTMIICFNGETQEIPVEQWEVYKAEGATEGRCDEGNIDTNPVEMITICYHPQGTQDLVQMDIPLSSWPAYQAGGAIQGPCPNITINPDTTSNSGGNSGGNSNGKITICHIPPGNPGNPQEIEIPLSAWPAHQAHGDVLGPCQNGTVGNDTISNQGTFNSGGSGRPGSGGRGDGMFDAQKITICFTPEGQKIPQTMQVPLNEWETYREKGASLGPCTTIPSNGGTIQGQPGQLNTNPTQGGQDSNGSGGQKNLDLNDDGRKAQEAAKAKAEAERKAKEAADQKAKLEAERKAAEEAKKAQEAAKAKAEAERQAKEAADQKAKLEAERKAAEEAKKAQEAAKAKAEAERQAKEAADQKAKLEAEQKAAEEAKKAQEAAKAKAEAERKAKEEAEKKAAEEKEKVIEEQKEKEEGEGGGRERATPEAERGGGK